MEIKNVKSNNKYCGHTSKITGINYIPDMIVWHITEGSYNGSVEWLCNSKSSASSHYVLSKKGKVTQLVSLQDSSWCNGTSTSRESKIWYNLAKNDIVRNREDNANYYTITIEHEGIFKKDGGLMPDEQFNTAVDLCIHIIKEIKELYDYDFIVDAEHIVGHRDINPKTKPDCPGKDFQMSALINRVKEITRGGWVYENGRWCVYKNYEKLKCTWFNSSGKWYYLGEDGYMLAGQWFKYMGSWYYLNNDGEMLKDTVVDGYKLDSNGVWVKG